MCEHAFNLSEPLPFEPLVIPVRCLTPSEPIRPRLGLGDPPLTALFTTPPAARFQPTTMKVV